MSFEEKRSVLSDCTALQEHRHGLFVHKHRESTNRFLISYLQFDVFKLSKEMDNLSLKLYYMIATQIKLAL